MLTSTSGHQQKDVFAGQGSIDGLLLVGPEAVVPEDLLIEALQLRGPGKACLPLLVVSGIGHAAVNGSRLCPGRVIPDACLRHGPGSLITWPV